MGSAGSGCAFYGAGVSATVRPTTRLSQQGVKQVTDHLNPAPEEEVAGGDGLSHYGDPEVEVIEEAEVEVLEEENPNCGKGDGPKVLKAPRAPTQREIDAHMATHLPHAAWCDICQATQYVP